MKKVLIAALLAGMSLSASAAQTIRFATEASYPPFELVDANNQIVPLCTQKAIVQLPGEPVILYEPGTWDGKASSES